MQSPRKIAVAGATGRVGRHTVDVLEERGHDVVPMSRSQGVDVITGDGLAAALAGVDCVIDVVAGPSPEQQAATTFFTTAAATCTRPAQRRASSAWSWCPSSGPTCSPPVTGPRRSLTRRPPVRPDPGPGVRAAQFHELVGQLVNWGARGDVAYVTKMRTQLVAARAVAEVLAGRPPNRYRPAHRSPRSAGPREESLVEMARLLAARRGYPPEIEGISDPADPDRELNENGALLPGPGAILTGPTFAQWLDTAS